MVSISQAISHFLSLIISKNDTKFFDYYYLSDKMFIVF